MDKKSIFASILKSLREEKKLNQEELGKSLGVSRGSVSYYEKGQRLPDIEILQKMTEFFNVSADYLIGNTEIKSVCLNDIAINKLLGLSENSIRILKDYKSYIESNDVAPIEFLEELNLLIETSYASSACNEFDTVNGHDYKYSLLYALKSYFEYVPNNKVKNFFVVDINNIFVGDEDKVSTIIAETMLNSNEIEQIHLLVIQNILKELKERIKNGSVSYQRKRITSTEAATNFKQHVHSLREDSVLQDEVFINSDKGNK